MKRLNLGAIAVLVVALSTFGLTISTAQAATHDVAVRLADSSKACVLIAPKNLAHPGFHVNANRGDTVNWNIENNCNRTMVVGISSFRPHPSIAGQSIDHPLVEAAVSLTATVASKKTGMFTAHVKTTIDNYGRAVTVYVYDIEELKGSVRVPIGDPEIEIP